MTTDGTTTSVYSFCSPTSCPVCVNFCNGSEPLGGLVQHTNGNFYGTTSAGGGFPSCGENPEGETSGCGTLFTFSTGVSPFVSLVRTWGKVGETVGMLGQGFSGATTVSFNGIPAARIGVSATYQKVIVPAGATTGFVTVTTEEGTLQSSQIFRVLPQITSFSPASGPAGSSVTIMGESFTGATIVTFDGKWQAKFTIDSDTQITAIVPANATVGKITVRTPGGSNQSTGQFTVTP